MISIPSFFQNYCKIYIPIIIKTNVLARLHFILLHFFIGVYIENMDQTISYLNSTITTNQFILNKINKNIKCFANCK
jgi:hypothetical protein